LKSSGAFVFGAMSFLDKLSNGVAVIVIENFHPCKWVIKLRKILRESKTKWNYFELRTCGCTICDNYYRDVLTFVCGGATVLALLALALLAPHEIGISLNSQSTTPTNGSVGGY